MLYPRFELCAYKKENDNTWYVDLYLVVTNHYRKHKGKMNFTDKEWQEFSIGCESGDFGWDISAHQFYTQQEYNDYLSQNEEVDQFVVGPADVNSPIPNFGIAPISVQTDLNPNTITISFEEGVPDDCKRYIRNEVEPMFIGYQMTERTLSEVANVIHSKLMDLVHTGRLRRGIVPGTWYWMEGLE